MKKRIITMAVAVTALAVLSVVAARVAAAPHSERAAAVVVTDKDVLLFPNPVERDFNMLCEKFDVEKLIIFNATGEAVFTTPMPIAHGSRLTVNMSSRASGYYTVKVWVKGAKQPLTSRIYKR